MANNQQGKKVEIHTLLKFVKSDKNESLVSYVSTNPLNGQIKGVRADSKYPHMIVVCSKEVAPIVLANVLYKATIVPMKSGKGYVCIGVETAQFKASLKTNYIPNSVYQIVVEFGNKSLVFDPYKGKKSTVLTQAGFIDMLQRRVDLENSDEIISNFQIMATELLKRMKKDGATARIA